MRLEGFKGNRKSSSSFPQYLSETIFCRAGKQRFTDLHFDRVTHIVWHRSQKNFMAAGIVEMADDDVAVAKKCYRYFERGGIKLSFRSVGQNFIVQSSRMSGPRKIECSTDPCGVPIHGFAGNQSRRWLAYGFDRLRPWFLHTGKHAFIEYSRWALRISLAKLGG